jgi:UPF0755 protein
MNKKRTFLVLGIVITLVVTAIFGYYMLFIKSNLSGKEGVTICVVKEETEALQVLSNNGLELLSESSWQLAAMLKKLRLVKQGRYRLKSGMSNNDIIGEFRSGGVSTLNLRIDDVVSLDELAAKLGNNMLHDSAHFMSVFTNDSLLKALEIDPMHVAAIVRPNTYEFFWNMNGEAFLRKMKSESDKLWTDARIEACSRLSMAREEVVILASIVKAETGATEEAPRIAGLYLNRLRIGMPLQSDPTAIFGRRKSTQRVYLNDIQSDSPYNTYKFVGLPPGPINFPESVYIDAVLKAEEHGFVFMCAEPGSTGKHRFAKSLSEHERNRKEYVTWLDKKGIR